jgi:hypothetical protein
MIFCSLVLVHFSQTKQICTKFSVKRARPADRELLISAEKTWGDWGFPGRSRRKSAGYPNRAPANQSLRGRPTRRWRNKKTALGQG